MHDKETELFAKGLLRLWERLCDECGARPIGSRVIVCDGPVDRLAAEPPAKRGA